MKTMNRAIFLDRDGVIIEEKGYICSLSQSVIFPFVGEAVRMMNESGFKVIGVTNQSAIARGYCTKDQVETIHREIIETLAKEGAVIDRFYYCPFLPGGTVPEYTKVSDLRKPAPGMILQAAADFDIDLSESYMMGDNIIDIETGINAGCKTVLVLTGKGGEMRKILEEKNIRPDLITENILTAIKMIVGM
jgi:D-glycero-D-manno-heptose 1,7-bisphosphate phosphatase